MRGLATQLKDLGAGRLPLQDAFWTYALFWGVLINVAASLAAMALIVAAKQGSPESSLPAILTGLSMAAHLAPVPYNLVALVGVWRSANRPGYPAIAAVAARGMSLFLFVAFSVL